MPATLANCLLLGMAIAGAASGADSIPAPTVLGELAAATGSEIAGRGAPVTVGSAGATATFMPIEVAAADGTRAGGLRLALESGGLADEVYLDAHQAAQLRAELLMLEARYVRAAPCEASHRCVHGIARCRPSQTVRQAICPGFYATPGGERGVLVSTPAGAFEFRSVSPAAVATALARATTPAADPQAGAAEGGQTTAARRTAPASPRAESAACMPRAVPVSIDAAQGPAKLPAATVQT